MYYYENEPPVDKSFFDLGTFIEEVRELSDPAKVYLLWENVTRLYETGKITRLSWGEAYDVVHSQLVKISEARRAISNV